MLRDGELNDTTRKYAELTDEEIGKLREEVWMGIQALDFNVIAINAKTADGNENQLKLDSFEDTAI